jgi:hypothetical protein
MPKESDITGTRNIVFLKNLWKKREMRIKKRNKKRKSKKAVRIDLKAIKSVRLELWYTKIRAYKKSNKIREFIFGATTKFPLFADKTYLLLYITTFFQAITLFFCLFPFLFLFCSAFCLLLSLFGHQKKGKARVRGAGHCEIPWLFYRL